MLEMAQEQPGFLEIESAHEAGGLGITVSTGMRRVIFVLRSGPDSTVWHPKHLINRLMADMGHRKWHRSDTLRSCRACTERSWDHSAGV